MLVLSLIHIALLWDITAMLYIYWKALILESNNFQRRKTIMQNMFKVEKF